MSRRSYKTVNLPSHVVDWTDSTLNGSPLGIKSRDEFVRIAVAVLGTALQPPHGGEAPLETVQHLLRQVQKEGVPA